VSDVPNPSDIPADEAAVAAALNVYDTDATGALAALTAAQAQVAALTASLAAANATIATLEAELAGILPNPPTNVVATAGPDSATVTWTASAANQGPPITGYAVMASSGQQTVVTGLTATFTNLVAGVAVTFQVVAQSAAGPSSSVTSNPVTPTAPATGEPDLIVSSIILPSTVVVGQKVVFGAVIGNQGTGPQPAGDIIGVAFDVNGTQVTWSDTDTAPLSPGQSVTCTANNGPASVNYWTPTAAGSYTIQAWVNDIARFPESNTANNKLTATVTVTAAPVKPTITSTVLPVATVGVAYSVTLTATGTAPISWSVAGLPSWLSLKGAVLSGMPVDPGSSNITITAQNPGGVTEVTSPITVNPAGGPVWTADTPPGGTVGVPYSYTLAATGGATFTASPLPPGLSLSGATITGTPTTVGSTTVTATATAAGITITATPTIAIAAATTFVAPTGGLPPSPATLLVSSAAAIWGVYYLPSPTIQMMGQNSGHNSSGTAAVAIGASSWQVISPDPKVGVVASGTCSTSASTLTLNSVGNWVSGGAILPGHYTIACNNGATGTFAVGAATSQLWRPPANYTAANGNSPPMSFAAVLGSGRDRDLYSVPQVGYTVYSTGAAAGAAIIENIQNDAYYGALGAPLDAARPRPVFIEPNPQPNYPTQNPTPAFWGQLATYMAANGYAGIWYGLPCNEPESGGWPIADTITYWQACATAILAADSTAKLAGWTSEGLFNAAPLSNLSTFLADCGTQLSAFSNHMEASDQNNGDFLLLRNICQRMQNQFTASGFPHMDYWNTETGIEGGQYGVLQPRREARQRIFLRWVMESFGWSSQKQYDFEVFDHQGSGNLPYNGLPMYLVDKMEGTENGNMRMGAWAVHCFNEALWGTSCSPTNKPALLNFGPTGSVGDSLFMGTHYTSASGDRVVLGSNGIPNSTVTLAVSCTGPITYYNGMGVPFTTTVSGGQITVPLDDLLTYVYLPASTTVSVVDTDQGVVAASSKTNLALTATVVNEASTAVPLVHDGNWGKNNSALIPTGTGLSTAPYSDTTIPASITVTLGSAQSIGWVAYKGPCPAWQQFGCGIIGVNITIDGTQYWAFADPTAVSYAIPSPSNGNSDDFCTMTTWWTSPYAMIFQLPTPVTGTVIKFNFTNTGYGGQPDLAASTNSTSHYNESDAKRLQLAQVAVMAA
jgi:CARDB/Fibronectin type III domain